MERVGIAVLYDGEWKSRGISKYEYVTKKSLMIVVSQSINYDEFTALIHSRLNVSRDEYEIRMKFNYRADVPMPPVEITDDDILQYFISENSGKQISTRTPLCITFEKRKSLEGIASGSYVLETVERNPTDTFAVENPNPMYQRPHSPIPSNGNVHIETMDEEGILFDDLQVCDSNTSHNNNDDKNEGIDHNQASPPVDQQFHASVRPSGLPSNMDGVGMDKVGPSDQYEDIRVGELYKSKSALQNKIGLMALKRDFQLTVQKSTTYLLVMKCVDCSCKWHMRATKVKGSTDFEVRRYRSQHTCDTSAPNAPKRKTRSKLLSESIKRKYECASRKYRPKDIIDDVRRQYGRDICYTTAWRARKIALDALKVSSKDS